MIKKLLCISLASILILAGCRKKNDNNKEVDEEQVKVTILQPDNKNNTENITPIESEVNKEEVEANEENEESDQDKKELKLGDLIEIDKGFNVYSNADDAANKSNPVSSYKAGNYYVYKIVENSVNLSKYPEKPGGWINLELLESYDPKLPDLPEEFVAEEETNPEPSSDTSRQSKSWSWAYPDTSSYMDKYNGIYKTNEEGVIYLTFDNGYEYNNLTSDILDVLKNNNVKAVFFTTSSYMEDNPNLSKRMVYEGHNLSNHTGKHLHQGEISAQAVKDDILAWEETYRNIIGMQPSSNLMRPPAGSYSETSLKVANDLGYNTVFWNFAYLDWQTENQPDPQESLKKLLDYNESGSIVLLHSVSQTNADILDQYIKETKKQGYEFKLLQ